MTIDKLDYEWADTGDTTEPSDAKKQAGWVGGDRPSIEYLNWVDNRQDDKIQRLIVEKTDLFYDGAANAQKMLTTGIWDENWGTTENTLNYMGSGAGVSYCDIKVFFTSDNEPRLLAFDKAADTIEVWDPRAKSLLDTSHDLTGDLTPAKTYAAMSMCTDGTYVYAVWYNSTDGAMDASCWKISDWSVRSGWGVTAMSGIVGSPTKGAEIIIADDDYLACINSINTIVAAATTTINLLDRTDGSVTDSGSGDCNTGVGAVGNPSIVSDGTNLFFTCTGGANQYMCSATIADLTAGIGGGAGFGVSVGALTGSVVGAAGGLVVSSYSHAAWAVGTPCLHTHTTALMGCEELRMGQNTNAAPLIGDDFIFGNSNCICYDGLSIYIVHAHTAPENSGVGLLKIDVSKLGMGNVTTIRYIQDLVPSKFLIAQDQTMHASSGTFRRCVFDGRDIWVNVEWQTGQTQTGRIYRLPLAALRS